MYKLLILVNNNIGQYCTMSNEEFYVRRIKTMKGERRLTSSLKSGLASELDRTGSNPSSSPEWNF